MINWKAFLLIWVCVFKLEAKGNLVELSYLHPSEVVVKKAEHLKQIGFKSISRWESLSTDEDVTKLVVKVHKLGIKGTGVVKTQIQDSILFTIIVSAALHGNTMAEGMINQYGRYDYIYKFSGPIKRLFRNRERKGLRLLLLCKLTESEKNELRKLVNPSSVELLAKLGDADAEAKLIKMFEKKPNFQTAKKLAYVGTTNTLKTLVAGLEKNEYTETYSSRRSVRLSILLALHLVFPSEQLFSTIPYELCSGKFDRNYPKEQIVGYAKALKSWAWDKFQVKLDIDNKDFYLNAYLGDIYDNYDPYGISY